MSEALGANIYPSLSGNNLIDQFGTPNPVNNQIAYYPVPASLNGIAQNTWNLAQWGQTSPLIAANYILNSNLSYDPLYGNAAYSWSNPGSVEALNVYNDGTPSSPNYVYSLTDGAMPAEGDMFLQTAVAPLIPAAENTLSNIINVSLDMKVVQSNWTNNTPLGTDIGIIVAFDGAGGLPISSGFIQINPFSTRYGNGISNFYENQSPSSDQGMAQIIYSNLLPGDPSLPVIPEDALAKPIGLTYNVNKYAANAFDQYFALLPTAQKSTYENLANWSVVGFYVGDATYNLAGGVSAHSGPTGNSGVMTVQYSNIHLTVTPTAFNPSNPPPPQSVASGPMINFSDASDTLLGPNGSTGQVEGSTMAGSNFTYDRYIYNGTDSISLSAPGTSRWYFGGGAGTDTIIGNGAVDTMIGSSSGTLFEPVTHSQIYVPTGSSSTISGSSIGNIIHLANSSSITVDITAPGAYADILGSDSTVMAGQGGDLVFLNGNDNTGIMGPDGSLLMTGSSNTVSGSGKLSAVADFGTRNNIFAAGGIVYEYGSHSTITAEGDVLLNFNGSGNTVFLEQANSTVQGGASESIIKDDHAYDAININSSGDTINLRKYSGADRVTVSGHNDIVNISSMANTVVGSGALSGSQIIDWSNSNDIMLGDSGSVIVLGGAATVTGQGGAIADFGNGNAVTTGGGIYYEYGSNSSALASDSTLVNFNGSDNSVTLGGGANTVQGGADNSTVYAGGNGYDTVTASRGIMIVNDGASIDAVNAGTGSMVVTQGNGAVTANGGMGSATLYGGSAGSNLLIGGGSGSNILIAGGGNSTLIAGGSSTTMIGSGQSDVFIAAAGSESIVGSTVAGATNQFFFGPQSSSLNATISGFNGSSQIFLMGGLTESGQHLSSLGDIISLRGGGTIELINVNHLVTLNTIKPSPISS